MTTLEDLFPPLMFTQENRDPDVRPFIRALRPGDQLLWDDRSRPLEVVFVDPTGDYTPRSMKDWTHTEIAVVRGQGDSYFRLSVLNGGQTIRVYRLTDSRWDYGSDSMGIPDEFRVVDRLPQPNPNVGQGAFHTGMSVVDQLNPWRWSTVVDPSDAVGDIVVEPRTFTDEMPYPTIEPKQYAIRPHEVIGWRQGGETPGFSL